MEELLKNIQTLIESGEAFVSVILVDSKGSTPHKRGGRILVTTSGLYFGTVGGGLIEAKTVEFAQDLIKEKNPSDKTKFIQWNLNKDVGMSCGGSVKIFFELYNKNSWEIIIFGAGHVAQALVPLLLNLDVQISCIDSRKDWLNKLPDSSKLKKICEKNQKDFVKNISDNAFVLVMTKGHRSDFYLVKEFLEIKEQPFLGVIGSRSKASTLKKELLNEGIEEKKINNVVCPIGFSLGGNHPQEIAISITAQLLHERDKLFGKIHTRNPLPDKLCTN